MSLLSLDPQKSSAMQLTFYKYQGTGNDFIMIDNRMEVISKNNTKLVNHLCDRKFGIGADGLILLENSNEDGVDFKMVYFNSDGNQSSMCGNGGRCIIAFARFLGIIKESCTFSAVDGLHEGRISDTGSVGLKMNDVQEVHKQTGFTFLDTGSPHHVVFSESIGDLDIMKKGSEIRYSKLYAENGGTNVNFVEVIDASSLRIRTYERGVENETLSCGTGATAAAIAAFSNDKVHSSTVSLATEGGSLRVNFEHGEQGFSNIWLEGPASLVFKGEIQC